MLDSAVPCPFEYCVYLAYGASGLIEHLKHNHGNDIDSVMLRKLAIMCEYYCRYKQKHEKIDWDKVKKQGSEFYECYE